MAEIAGVDQEVSARFFRLAFISRCVVPLLFCVPAWAANDAMLRQVEEFVRDTLGEQPGLQSVVAGPVDPRLRLPACTTLQPYLPVGMDVSRLAGQTQVGVRCLSPSRWSIFVPVKIAIERSYLAAAVSLPAGRILQPGDWIVRTADASSLPAGVIGNPEEAIGKTLRLSLQAGQPLRAEQLAAPVVIQQGQTVRLVFHGEGFSATNEGRALNRASAGQVAQARTVSGIVVSGIAQPDGTILVSP
ncbi:MAG: flagellar basal body P-ring formation protein FlgA [Betaproteobacteria bacterium]|nr:flagellar basal body P-ring formation protein FlgA [Betaproteobacteria bacterium]